MTSLIDIYGYSPQSLLKSAEDVYRRLQDILADKILRFNPYLVDDDVLLSCVERAVWQPWPSLTQMVVFHFHELGKAEWIRPYDAIFLHIGASCCETCISIKSITDGVTYTATRRQVHVTVDGRPITNVGMVERLCRKDYFVSHALRAVTPNGKLVHAYRMHRLIGSAHDKAEMIRRSMTESKIEMLQEILAHPYCSEYLQCSRNYIDYATPIKKAIEIISNYPYSKK